MDLSTTYLGLKLRNPLIAGASPLTEQIETVRALEANGAAAVVMPSLYEEHMRAKPVELPFYEELYEQASEAGAVPAGLRSPLEPGEYLDRLTRIKNLVGIPVFASISCTAQGEWIEYARLIEKAGADGLELNVYIVPVDPSLTSEDVEKRIMDIVACVRHRVKLPLAIKLYPFYTALPHLVKELAYAGANGVVLFNRSYHPDIDVEKRLIAPQLNLSHVSEQTELRLRLRWLALLSPWTQLSLALTGGVHTGLDAIKGIMSGAHAVQIVSSLLNAGPEYMNSLVEQFTAQMRRTGADSVGELRGCLNVAASSDPGATERAQYVTALHSWPAQRH